MFKCETIAGSVLQLLSQSA